MSNYNKAGDDELVSLLNKGDQHAYTEIYHRYHAGLYIHVFNKLRSREESKDIVHELFTRLWHRREELSVTTTLATYLYAAARYQVFDHLTRRKQASKYLDSIIEFTQTGNCITDHPIREKQLLALIDKEIAGLPPKMREIFELSRKENLSHKQIAEKLSLSEQTVKKQVHNSLKILRSKLGSTLFTAFFL